MSGCATAATCWRFGLELSAVCRAFPRAPANETASAIKSLVSIRTGENVDGLDPFFMSCKTPLDELHSRANKCNAGANRAPLILNQLSKLTGAAGQSVRVPGFVCPEEGDNLSGQERPAFFHRASTRLCTSALIVITSGQGRWKPSSFHLRVASMPIFEP